MDRRAFYDRIRTSLFGGRIAQHAVDGIEAILDSATRNRMTDPRHVANVLSQVFHETGRHMLPIKETVMPSHKDKNPSDATVIKRLDTAFAKGQLPWVKTPYWRQGWFGRGPIQITHRENYERMGRRLGVDLAGNRDLALDPVIGADIAVIGMAEGMFTGRKLSDYLNDRADDPASARRIVNGPDGNDAKIAGYHRAFLDALTFAGYGAVAPAPALPEPEPEDVYIPESPPIVMPQPPVCTCGGVLGQRPVVIDQPVAYEPPHSARAPSPVEQSSKAFGAGKWAVAAGALWSAVVASGYLPPAFATAEFASVVGGLISTIAAAIGAYRAPPNAEVRR